MKSVRPYVFIGSSTEGLPIARAVQYNLNHVCEPELWTEFFDVGQVTLGALANKLPTFDFAVFVITGDDSTISRKESSSSPRDNVILELGLSIGAIGGGRTFIIYNRDEKPKLPSDLAGVTAATFQPPDQSDLRTALRPACLQIEKVVEQLGIRTIQPRDRHHGGEVSHTDEGIVSSQDFAANTSGFIDENFAIQLLAESVKLKRQDGCLRVTIDRRNVTEVVISDVGKRALCQRYVFGREEELIEEDGKIQRFIADTVDDERDVDPQKLKLRLRWASGGVLSIVSFRGDEYVPMFFRDIRPYGWNISLGSSERHFISGTASDPNDEWENPLKFVTREFLEESLVIDRDPAASPVILKLFTSDEMDTIISDKFVAQHAAQRSEEDGLVIQGGEAAMSLPVAFDPANSDIEVTPHASLRPSHSKGMLVCFSLLDLGIEVVRIARYSLRDDDYMLDGEILKRGEKHTKELVRMPIALFRCDYLTQTFGKNDGWYRYTHGTMPSIKVSRLPTGPDVHLFPWDIIRRMEIIQGKNCPKTPTAWQIQRFTDWYDKFGRYFLGETGIPSAARLPDLFVPGTAKILNQYFSMPAVFKRYTRG